MDSPLWNDEEWNIFSIIKLYILQSDLVFGSPTNHKDTYQFFIDQQSKLND